MFVKNLLKQNTPFAVMQYFVSLKSSKKETSKVYELMYLNSTKKSLLYKILTQEEISFIKENNDKIKLIIKNEDGKIYEFNNFKKYKEENKVCH
jgi:hypothetical protein